MNRPVKQSCFNCQFFDVMNITGAGRCRRFPPNVPTPIQGEARHPRVFPTNWCGEWSRIKR